GNYTQTATGILDIEVGGLAYGTQHDALNVVGTATLGGTLNVIFRAPYVPQDGDAFLVMFFGARAGDFATVNIQNLPGSFRLDLVFDPTTLTFVLRRNP